jgi:hypothetical protein
MATLAARLGSLRLAVCLLPLFAGVLFLGAVIESRHDRETAAEVVYRTWWFGLLLGLLGVNIFFAAIKKWPWQRHQTGFLITHLGLLSLVAGGIIDSLFGTSGTITLIDSAEPTAARLGRHETDRLLERSGEVIRIRQLANAKERLEIPFHPGPIGWGAGPPEPLPVDGLTAFLARLARPISGTWSRDLGKDARLEVLAYHPRSRVRPFRPDGGGKTFPAVKVQLSAGAKSPVKMGQLPPLWVAYASGHRTVHPGPALVEMLAAASRPEHIEEFLHPPTPENLGSKGLLVVGLEGKTYRLDVEKSLGVTTPLGDSGCAVQLLHYLPDFRNRTQTAPVNPAVVFLLTGRSTATLTTAARQAGEVVQDRSSGRLSPDFWAWYHAPDQRYGETTLRGLLQFAAAADGRLYYRSFRSSAEKFVLEHVGIVPRDNSWQPVWGVMDFRFQVADYLPHAGTGPYFEPAGEGAAPQEGGTTAALRCRITAGPEQQEFWLGKTEEGYSTIDVGGNRFEIGYHPVLRDLGFTVTLLRAEQTLDRGSPDPASQSSEVVITDAGKSSREPQWITLNEPLSHQGYKVYQSGFQTVGRDKDGQRINRATFIVNRDPGLYLKYAGSILLVAGIACMFYMRAYFFGPRRKPAVAEAAAEV